MGVEPPVAARRTTAVGAGTRLRTGRGRARRAQTHIRTTATSFHDRALQGQSIDFAFGASAGACGSGAVHGLEERPVVFADGDES